MMESEITAALVNAGAELASYATKSTAATVRTRIKKIKVEKDNNKIRNEYNEIITELLEEREDIIRIAQIYRNELERVQISDEDIESLHRTIEKALDILSVFADGDGTENTIESLKPLKDLISVDVLKTMQLLGFNYKAAIGEPLTQLCATAITKIGSKNNVHLNKTNKGNK